MPLLSHLSLFFCQILLQKAKTIKFVTYKSVKHKLHAYLLQTPADFLAINTLTYKKRPVLDINRTSQNFNKNKDNLEE